MGSPSSGFLAGDSGRSHGSGAGSAGTRNDAVFEITGEGTRSGELLTELVEAAREADVVVARDGCRVAVVVDAERLDALLGQIEELRDRATEYQRRWERACMDHRLPIQRLDGLVL